MTTERIDLLARPVYGMAQTDWILRLRPGTARRWIEGYERRGMFYPPIVRVVQLSCSASARMMPSGPRR